MKMAVTGALGHIGSRLIHDLKPGEFEDVLLIDDLSAQRYCSLFNLPEGIPFRFMEADVCSAELERLFDGMDAVIHLAAITNAAGSFEIQDQVERVNFEGTRRVAAACAATGSRMLFLSTTSVYGTQQEVVDESCPVEDLKPQSPYADSKLRAEAFLTSLGSDGGLRFITCRFGTIFGTSIGMRFHTAVNKFCWQAVNGQPITVWRTALEQRRPYLELGDGVGAIRHIVAGDHFDRGIYNVLTTNATVREIVDAIRVHVPEVRVDLVDSPIMNQLSYTVSPARFEGLGFRSTGDLRSGIGDTIALFRGLQRPSGVAAD